MLLAVKRERKEVQNRKFEDMRYEAVTTTSLTTQQCSQTDDGTEGTEISLYVT